MSSAAHEGGINIDQYKYVHQSKGSYGAGSRHFDYVRLILCCCEFKEVIDYGCGKGVLAGQLNEIESVECAKFDPAIPGIDSLPDCRFDAVINTDVLEHVPEQELDGVISNFTKLSRNAILIPHLAKAREVLPNGENAHCTIKTPGEWRAILLRHYRNVIELPHASKKHALFLCSFDQLETDCIRLGAEFIASGTSGPNDIRLDLDSPFLQRLKHALKLLLGLVGVNFIRKVSKHLR